MKPFLTIINHYIESAGLVMTIFGILGGDVWSWLWLQGQLDRDDPWVGCPWIASRKKKKNDGKIHHFSWENSRFLWWFSICESLPEGILGYPWISGLRISGGFSRKSLRWCCWHGRWPQNLRKIESRVKGQ